MGQMINYNQILTPSYIFDIDILKTRIKRLRENLNSEYKICFAMKANPFLIKSMGDLVDKFEVCSPGEYEICILQGIKLEKIIVSGVNKTMLSMRRIVEISSGHGIYTIESMQHYHILSSIAKDSAVCLKVLVRLSNGNQFGIDKQTLEQIIKCIKVDSNMELIGVHFFTGTQKKMKKIEEELKYLDMYALELRKKYNLKTIDLEYGPGLSVSYFELEENDSIIQRIKELNIFLNNLKYFNGITIEMGRFISAECGSFLTEVVDLKDNEGVHYAILDGGIHQINYFGQMMGMKHPPIVQVSKSQVNEKQIYCIAGSLCTTNDILLRKIELNKMHIGDRLLFQKCGAYSITEGIALFLSRELPSVYLYSNDTGLQCVREKVETYTFNFQYLEERNEF